MIKIDTVCEILLNALIEAEYSEATIFGYKGVIRRFKQFCKEQDVDIYTPEFGKTYADDVISKVTGKFSKQRYFSQGRFIRLLDSYYYLGKIDLSVQKRGMLQPEGPEYKEVFLNYQRFLFKKYCNINSVHFYSYEVYCLMQVLYKNGLKDISMLTFKDIVLYLKTVTPNRQRAALCGIRSLCRFLDRNDLTKALSGIRGIRQKKIIPVLSSDEIERLNELLYTPQVSARDRAIVLFGLYSGIRACDLIQLQLNDIHWENETISFVQSKTGNRVNLPLLPEIGNAIYEYITEERPISCETYLFLRSFAPYRPLTEHSACYSIIKKIFKLAGIEKGDRIWGMHLLRHNTASMMVKNEVPLETIAAVLGHSTPDTTDIYITTNEQMLSQCVLPFKGISLEVNA